MNRYSNDTTTITTTIYKKTFAKKRVKQSRGSDNNVNCHDFAHAVNSVTLNVTQMPLRDQRHFGPLTRYAGASTDGQWEC